MDFKAAGIEGAFSFGKVRVLWQNNTLKCFDKSGLVKRIKSSEPVRRRRWLNTWDVDTANGPITITGKCWTCGGWYKAVASKDAGDLWID